MNLTLNNLTKLGDVRRNLTSPNNVRFNVRRRMDLARRRKSSLDGTRLEGPT